MVSMLPCRSAHQAKNLEYTENIFDRSLSRHAEKPPEFSVISVKIKLEPESFQGNMQRKEMVTLYNGHKEIHFNYKLQLLPNLNIFFVNKFV